MMSDGPPKFAALKGPASPYFGVTGAQAGQAREKDAAVQRLRGFRTEPSAAEYQQLLAAFKASPATGCATVLDQLRRKAKYTPADPEKDGGLMFFYVGLIQHPLFSKLPFDAFSFEMKVGMGNPAPDPDAIVRRYQGSDEEASRRIRRQYDVLMQNAIANRGKTQEGDLLQEHSLGVRDRLTFLYIRTALMANLDMLPPATVIGIIKGSRYGFEFAFDTAKWPSYAEAVLREDLKTLDDWLYGL
jgi:hypothetical protein